MKEVIVTPRTPTSQDYRNEKHGIELCGAVTVSFIDGPVQPRQDIIILLSNNDSLEHEVKCAGHQGGICCYLCIDGKDVQVLGGAYAWVKDYLGSRTGSMTIAYK